MEELARMIRKEIAKAQRNRELCGYPSGSVDDVALEYEIVGMRRVLGLVDPHPWRE